MDENCKLVIMGSIECNENSEYESERICEIIESILKFAGYDSSIFCTFQKGKVNHNKKRNIRLIDGNNIDWNGTVHSQGFYDAVEYLINQQRTVDLNELVAGNTKE